MKTKKILNIALYAAAGYGAYCVYKRMSSKGSSFSGYSNASGARNRGLIGTWELDDRNGEDGPQIPNDGGLTSSSGTVSVGVCENALSNNSNYISLLTGALNPTQIIQFLNNMRNGYKNKGGCRFLRKRQWRHHSDLSQSPTSTFYISSPIHRALKQAKLDFLTKTIDSCCKSDEPLSPSDQPLSPSELAARKRRGAMAMEEFGGPENFFRLPKETQEEISVDKGFCLCDWIGCATDYCCLSTCCEYCPSQGPSRN